jgi:hypothetical protein
MNTQSNPAQNSEQTQAKKLNPNFTHRLVQNHDDDLDFQFILSVESIALRANSVLRLVADSLVCDGSGKSIIDSDVLFFAIQSARKDVEDMVAVSNEFAAKRKA